VTYAPYFLSSTFIDIEQIGGAAIYRLAPKVWGAVELGITASNFHFDHAQVPFGISAGYEVLPGIAFLPGLRFPDIGTPAARALQVLVVYAWDLGGRQATGAPTPEIPLETTTPAPPPQ
jgi:hypothetical protein